VGIGPVDPLGVGQADLGERLEDAAALLRAALELQQRRGLMRQNYTGKTMRENLLG